MLGLGWSEMLVIAVVALIVVGPKDLPVLLRNLGRAMGTVRKMSNEFRREIDKAIAADEFREAKKSISDPLKQTSQDLTREFNTLRNGKVEPSGKLAPVDPAKESVVDEIRAQAGMKPLQAPSAEQVPVTPPNAATTTAQQAVPLAAPASSKIKAAPRKAKTSAAAASKAPTSRTSNAKKTTAKPKSAAASTADGSPKASRSKRAKSPAVSETVETAAPKPAKRPRKTAAPKAKPPVAGED